MKEKSLKGGLENNEHYLIKKDYGIFFNGNGKIDKEYLQNNTWFFRKLNYTTLASKTQSIHHVNLSFDDNGSIEKITIVFRKLGIKPEDIDGSLLMKKNRDEGLNNYENLLLSIWKYHIENGKPTYDDKFHSAVNKEVYKLYTSIKYNRYVPRNQLSEEDNNNIEEKCKEMILNLTKYMSR